MKRKGAGYHHGDLRRALVQATIRLVDEHGTDGFTLRAAAKLAGVSDGAPYHHFADKDALLATVAEDGFRLLRDEMTRAAARATSVSERRVAMGVAYLQFATKHPARFSLMFGLWRTGRGRGASGAPRHAPSQMSGMFTGGPEGVGDDSRDLAIIAWSLVHGLSTLVLDGHLRGSRAAPRSLERLVRACIGALDSSRGRTERTPRTHPRPPAADEVPKSSRRRQVPDDVPKSGRQRLTAEPAGNPRFSQRG